MAYEYTIFDFFCLRCHVRTLSAIRVTPPFLGLKPSPLSHNLITGEARSIHHSGSVHHTYSTVARQGWCPFDTYRLVRAILFLKRGLARRKPRRAVLIRQYCLLLIRVARRQRSMSKSCVTMSTQRLTPPPPIVFYVSFPAS